MSSASSNSDSKDVASQQDSTKQKLLTAALGEIEKSYGKGAIMRLGAKSADAEIRGVRTGAMSLDMALGGRGIPRGRVCEIFGPDGPPPGMR